MLIAKTRIKLHRKDGVLWIESSDPLPKDLSDQERRELLAMGAVIDQVAQASAAQELDEKAASVEAKFAQARGNKVEPVPEPEPGPVSEPEPVPEPEPGPVSESEPVPEPKSSKKNVKS